MSFTRQKQPRCQLPLRIFSKIDRRTSVAREIDQRAQNIAQQMGGWACLSSSQRSDVERAAIAEALASISQERCLRGDIDIDTATRAANYASRIAGRLVAETAPETEDKPSALDEYLRAKHGGAE